MDLEVENRMLVSELIRKVLVGVISVREAVTMFPFDTDDKSIEAAYHALIHYEADEDLRKRDILYKEEQDEYLELIFQTLGNGESLPDNIIRNYKKYYVMTFDIILKYWNDSYIGGRKSIPYEVFKNNGYIIKEGYLPRLNYLKVIDEIYF